MRHRSFCDLAGREWIVSEVTKGLPTFAPSRATRDGKHAHGPIGTRRRTATLVASPWLCFESRRERRRLARVPDQWDDLGDADLQCLLRESHDAALEHMA